MHVKWQPASLSTAYNVSYPFHSRFCFFPIIDCCLITAENNGVNNIWVPKLQNLTSKGDTKFFEQVHAMLLIFVQRLCIECKGGH